MGITGITLVENTEYFSQYDTGEDDTQKTAWTLGAVDVMVRSSIQDNAQSWVTTEHGMQMLNKSASRNYELVRFGLKDVKNFKDKSGGDIKIAFVDRLLGGSTYQVVSDAFLKTVPGPVIAELAEEIIKMNTASDITRKK